MKKRTRKASQVGGLAIVGLLLTSAQLLAHDGYSWDLVNDGELVVSTVEDNWNANDISYPSVVKIPTWVTAKADPAAKYYMYYAEHHGKYIRMKWAPSIEGPWTEYNPSANFRSTIAKRVGVMDFVSDSFRNRDHPDAGEWSETWVNRLSDSGHIAAPDVMVDDENQVFIMAWHGKCGSRNEISMSDGESTDYSHTHSSGYVSFSKNGFNFNDPDTGGGEDGTWVDQFGKERQYGPLEVNHPKDIYKGEKIGITQKIGNEYARLMKIHGKFVSFGTGGQISRPLWDDPWATKRSGSGQASQRPKDRFKQSWETGPDIIANFFKSSAFANHPNNPVPGKTTGNTGAKVNHIEVSKLSENRIEAFIYIRVDTGDVFNMLLRTEVDVTGNDWSNWKIAKEGGREILDVVVFPNAMKNAVLDANGKPRGLSGAALRAFAEEYAVPNSMGVPAIYKEDGKVYAFVGFAADGTDVYVGHSEGQIACLELRQDGAGGGGGGGGGGGVNYPPATSFEMPATDIFGLAEGSSLFVEANADDSDVGDSIASVDLFINGVLVRKEKLAPYRWGENTDPALADMAKGEYLLELVAYDQEGLESEVAERTVVVVGELEAPVLYEAEAATIAVGRVYDSATRSGGQAVRPDADEDYVVTFNGVDGVESGLADLTFKVARAVTGVEAKMRIVVNGNTITDIKPANDGFLEMVVEDVAVNPTGNKIDMRDVGGLRGFKVDYMVVSPAE